MIKILLLIFLTAVVFLAVGCVGPLRTECYVRVKDQAASITISGILAGQTCSDMVAKQQWNLTQMVLIDSQVKPTEPILCEYDVSGQHFTVRDQGLVPAIGMVLCDNLKNKSQSVGSQSGTPTQ